MNQPLHCYRIDAGQPFLPTLAAWLLAEYGAGTARFTQVLILLPNRRACRALRETFLEASGGKPMLLPRIRPIGESDEDELALYEDSDRMPAIPEAIPASRRRFLLMRLIMDFEQRRQGIAYNAAQAAALADQLARLIDDVWREGADFSRLKELAPPELAAHWQQTLDFLDIVSQHWPKILETEGTIDPVNRRNQLLRATARQWEKNPPAYPVIAAGSTGSQPATAELLKVIARLEQGMIVLPGLDTSMPESEWELVEETHPQFGMKQLLWRIECPRAQVKPLVPAPASTRVECLQAVMKPARATAAWRNAKLPLAEGLRGMQRLSADTPLDEARMIATSFRQTLATPGKTAALITPDRNLARMVAAQMQRFGVLVDDSAGRPLADAPPASLFRLAMEFMASQASPATLLALLRHPLAACATDAAQCRYLSRIIEIKQLRGVRKAPGMESLIKDAEPEAAPLLKALAEQAEPLMKRFGDSRRVPLSTLLQEHIRFAEWLAGREVLWAGEAGNRLAELLAELVAQADVLPPVDPHAYLGLFEELLKGESYRPRGAHPRLQILSPIEARLLQFDRVILAGLNEGTWPAAPAADPWMSRPMRKKFGLPPVQQAIGQAAHDFEMLACAPEVLLSRSRKSDGAPTIPSRWLVRLETLIGGLDKEQLVALSAESYYQQARDWLDAPADIEAISAPAPRPPREARPPKLRVTAIDTWLRDPYMTYAAHVLKLNKLKPLDQEPEAAEFGTIIHKALEGFAQKFPGSLPKDPYRELIICGQDAFAEYIDRPAVACLWWPRFESMASWLVAEESERRKRLSAVYAELQGTWHMKVDGKAFTLTTRIDRLEVEGGKATVADYKTGSVPTQSDIEKGLANQLLLEALIAMHGTLEPPLPHPVGVSGLEYWKLAGNPAQCKITTVDGRVDELLAGARQRLEDLVRRFDDPNEPYAAQTNPALLPRYNDYAHLTRRQEWQGV